MPKTDPRIDAYIATAPGFARPILTEIRARVHAACPDVEESVKWSSPAFSYKGLLCGMVAFKQHCIFRFWKSDLVFDGTGDECAALRGEKITSLADMPGKKAFREAIRRAMALNDAGVSAARPAKAAKPPVAVPPDLLAALRKNTQARTAFDAFSPSHRREYVEWITEAKTDATRARRLEQTVSWLAEGKPRNWKYMPAPRA